MSLLLSVSVGLLYTIAFHQILEKDTFRLAFGVYLLLNATNLMILATASARGRVAPFAHLDAPLADPLVQAMVLTAIVIGFGIATWLLLLVARLSKERKTQDTDRIRSWRR